MRYQAKRAWALPVLVGLAACGGDRMRPPSNPVDGGTNEDTGVTTTCGNATRETGESCDSDSLECTTPAGYPGAQRCNSSCNGYEDCTSPLSCGDGVCSAGVESTESCPSDCISGSSNDRTREQGVVIRVRSEAEGFPRTNLIDDDASTPWRDDADVTYIEIDFSGTSAGAYVIDEFTFTSAPDSPGADPSWWTLIATAGGGQWDTLHNGSGVTFQQRGEKLGFTIAAPASYRVYRFDMGNHGAAFTHVAELEMLEAGPAVCGNGSVDGVEVCDGNTQSCTAPSGYPGTERCNLGCSGWEACTTSLFCGDAICSPGPENNGNCAQDCPVSTYPPPPVYNGTCPAMTHGNHNNFASGGRQREFELRLPPDPVGAPVVFAWHALDATPQDAMIWPGLDQIYESEGFIIVAPYSCCASEWVIGGDPNQNPDLAIFDDVLACLIEQYSVDVDRVYATGFSAGGLYTSYLLQVRSGHLAAAAPFSGGLLGAYNRPEFDLPVLFTWGGSGDLYGSFSFETATLNLSNALQNDGHFVIHCSGSFGHSQPSDGGAWAWRFFLDHPRGVAPEPYLGGLPGALPGYCAIP